MEQESSTFFRILAETEDVELFYLYTDLDSVKEKYCDDIQSAQNVILNISGEDFDCLDTARYIGHDALEDLLDSVQNISEKILLRSPDTTLNRRLEELYFIMKDIDMWRVRSHAEATTCQPVHINPPKTSVQEFIDTQSAKISEGSSNEIDDLEDLQKDLVNSYEERAKQELGLCLRTIGLKREMVQDLDDN